MAGDFVPESELNLQGIHKYYNSYTLRGRFNWVVTTYSVLFGLILLWKGLRPSKRKDIMRTTSPDTGDTDKRRSAPQPRSPAVEEEEQEEPECIVEPERRRSPRRPCRC